MRLWIVYGADDTDHYVAGIYSSKQKAETRVAWLKAHRNGGFSYVYIREWELDKDYYQ